MTDRADQDAYTELLRLIDVIPDGALDGLVRSVALGGAKALDAITQALKDGPDDRGPTLAEKLDRAGIINITASPVDIDDVIEAIVRVRTEQVDNGLLKAGELAPLLLRSLADARTQRDAYAAGLHETVTAVARLRFLTRDARRDNRLISPDEIDQILDRNNAPGGTP